jgi:hypothetical protein
MLKAGDVAQVEMDEVNIKIETSNEIEALDGDGVSFSAVVAVKETAR